jgi:class 3 adenylate cyclase
MAVLRSMSVQSRMLVAFVFLTLLAIGTVFGIGYVNARASLRAAAEGQLVGLQRSKTNLVRSVLERSRADVLTFSSLLSVTDSAVAFGAAYRSLRPRDLTPEMERAVRAFYAEEFEPALARHSAIEPVPGSFLPASPAGWILQYHYVATAPRPYGSASVVASRSDRGAYARALAAHQPLLERRMKQFGFEQMLLVDSETLDVFYSFQPSTVLGTSLRDGPYATSQMAELARSLASSTALDDYSFADFEPHRPALGRAKGFVGTPVFDGARHVAILLVRFPIEPVEAALHGFGDWEQEGLGRSGEVYLIGPDSTMRTESRFLLEDREAFLEALSRSRLTRRTVGAVRRLGETKLVLPVRSPAAEEALRGQTGIVETEDYRGERVLSAYGPLDVDSVRWGVLAERDVAEIEAPLRAYTRRVLAASVGLALLAAVLATIVSAALTRPIGDLVRGARRVSQGELDLAVRVARGGEYRELGEAFNDMVQSLRVSRAELDRQVRENERLLVSLLPASGAAHVREGKAGARQAFADVTVAYVSLVGLEALSRDQGDERAMDLLSEIVAAWDEAAEEHDVEKVRTIGSSYLAASGLSVERPDHTARMVDFAREAVRIVKRFTAERGTALVVEIGINAGPVIGGLVGRRRFIYDLWGDTVKLARNIESDGRTSILVTRPVYERVRDTVTFAPARALPVRGMGNVDLYAVADEAFA